MQNAVIWEESLKITWSNMLLKTFCPSAKFKIRSGCSGQRTSRQGTSKYVPAQISLWAPVPVCDHPHSNFSFFLLEKTFLTRTTPAATWIGCSLFCHMHLWEESGPSSMSAPRGQLKEAVSSHHWQLLQRLEASPPLLTLHVLQPCPCPAVLHLTLSSVAMFFSYWVALHCTQCCKVISLGGGDRKILFPAPSDHAFAKTAQCVAGFPAAKHKAFLGQLAHWVAESTLHSLIHITSKYPKPLQPRYLSMKDAISH